MADDKEKKDFTKGRKYKALTRISFGHERPAVEAGEVFALDDEELAKKLLSQNSISKDLEHEEPVNQAGGTNAGAPASQHLPPGQVKTAAEVAGDAADEAGADEEGHGRRRARSA